MSEDKWVGNDVTSHILLETPKIDDFIKSVEKQKRPLFIYLDIADVLKEIKEILTKLASK